MDSVSQINTDFDSDLILRSLHFVVDVRHSFQARDQLREVRNKYKVTWVEMGCSPIRRVHSQPQEAGEGIADAGGSGSESLSNSRSPEEHPWAHSI